ncbi:MAG: sulfurtransferase TusA family protein [Candidatus Methylomirabilia bacterium]
MEGGIKIAQTLDCKGLLCPMPIIKLAKAIKGIHLGEVLEMLATDPGSVPDMEAFQAQTGHEIAARDEQNGVYRFLVRRTK